MGYVFECHQRDLSYVFFSIDIVTDDRLLEDRRTETQVGLCIRHLALTNKMLPNLAA